MIRSALTPGYSSEVRMRLTVGDRVFDVAQVHDEACILRNPADVAPGPAELSITIDGYVSTKSVTLRDGIQAESARVCFG